MRTIQSAHSATKLEIKGAFTIQGPQVVGGKGGVPEWVYDLFVQHPEIKEIAFNFENSGDVYHQPYELIKDKYRESVKFTKTGQYGCGPDDEDDVYTVEEFKEFVESNAFIDYDGYGHPVKDSKANPDIHIKPSRVSEIPNDATHIVWYNR